MRLPKYTDDEVKFFHPVFEYSFKPIITNNKFFSNYELVHHRKIKNGTIPDYIFQNKKNPSPYKKYLSFNDIPNQTRTFESKINEYIYRWQEYAKINKII